MCMSDCDMKTTVWLCMVGMGELREFGGVIASKLLYALNPKLRLGL